MMMWWLMTIDEMHQLQISALNWKLFKSFSIKISTKFVMYAEPGKSPQKTSKPTSNTEQYTGAS
jgi:hypothetical protein